MAGAPVVSDGSFEAGTPNPSWVEYSDNFGTPLCTVADCGTGGGTGPRSGTWWTWLGGFDGEETAWVEQEITIPKDASAATLKFWLEIPTCAASGIDVFEVSLDAIIVYSTDDQDVGCNQTGYQEIQLDVSSWAGFSATLRFYASVNGQGPPLSSITNFFLDDVSIEVQVPLSFTNGFESPLP